MASMPGATTIRPRSSRSASPPAAGKTGSFFRARLTLATTPGVRMLPARQRSDGPTATGSTSPTSVRFGIEPGDDGAGRDLLARREDDAGRAPVARS